MFIGWLQTGMSHMQRHKQITDTWSDFSSIFVSSERGLGKGQTCVSKLCKRDRK